MADVIDLEAHRAARAIVVPNDDAAAHPSARPGWLCRLDVFAAEPGSDARAGFLALNQDRLAAPADLNGLADALEQIAASLRHAAKADAV